MQFLYQKRSIVIVILCLFLNFSFGMSEAQQEEKTVKIPDSPPQITITLRSNFIFEQIIEPDPSKNQLAVKAPFPANNTRGSMDKRKPFLPTLKVDEGYQSIKRFERVFPEKTEKKLKEKLNLSKKKVRKTVKVPDKALILGGRGFNIQSFDSPSDISLGLDYTTHLTGQAQYIQPFISNEHLDLTGEYSMHLKDLIFGEARTAFGKMPTPLSKYNAIHLGTPDDTSTVLRIEKSPNSVLAFPPDGESIAFIQRDEKPLDLLVGNEILNKKHFSSK